MCLEHDDYVQISRCPHGAFHLRVANTTLHLTRSQLRALHTQLNRCLQTAPPHPTVSPDHDAPRHNPFGRSLN